MFEEPTGAVTAKAETKGKAKDKGKDKKPETAMPEVTKAAEEPRKHKPVAVAESSVSTTIHANQCVPNSECVFTPNCRGRLRTTNPVGGKVQFYCPKCGVFAAGQKSLNGMVSAGQSGPQLFDRTSGKVIED